MRKNRRIGVSAALLFILGAWLSPALAADLKVAYVDIQKAINECNAGKEAKKVMAREAERFQRQIGEKQKDLQTMKESLEKQGPMLTAEARTVKEKDYQQKVREFQRWGEDSQNELNQKKVELERNISSGLLKVIQKLGADDGYTLIFEKNESIVLFASKTVDLTDRVIKAFDTQKK